MTVRLPQDLADRLEAEHARTDAPRQRIIERALDAYLPPLGPGKRRLKKTRG